MRSSTRRIGWGVATFVCAGLSMSRGDWTTGRAPAATCTNGASTATYQLKCTQSGLNPYGPNNFALKFLDAVDTYDRDGDNNHFGMKIICRGKKVPPGQINGIDALGADNTEGVPLQGKENKFFGTFATAGMDFGTSASSSSWKYRNIKELTGVTGMASLLEPLATQRGTCRGTLQTLIGGGFEPFPEVPTTSTATTTTRINEVLGVDGVNVFDWTSTRTVPTGKSFSSNVTNAYGGRFRAGIEHEKETQGSTAGRARMQEVYGVKAVVNLMKWADPGSFPNPGDLLTSTSFLQGRMDNAYGVYARVEDPGTKITTSNAVYAVGSVAAGDAGPGNGTDKITNQLLFAGMKNGVHVFEAGNTTTSPLRRVVPVSDVNGVTTPSLFAQHGTILEGPLSGLYCPVPFLHSGDMIKGFGFYGQVNSASSITVRLWWSESMDLNSMSEDSRTTSLATNTGSAYQRVDWNLNSPITVASTKSFAFQVDMGASCSLKNLYLIMGTREY